MYTSISNHNNNFTIIDVMLYITSCNNSHNISEICWHTCAQNNIGIHYTGKQLRSVMLFTTTHTLNVICEKHVTHMSIAILFGAFKFVKRQFVSVKLNNN